MTLLDASCGREYIITHVQTGDTALDAFLLSLGCYRGQPICVIARRKHNCTVCIQDSRYCMDHRLAARIHI